MTNEQILKKAIKKAMKNGWNWKQWDFAIKKDGSCYDTAWLLAIIFSHDFAKAFWGERIEEEKREGANHQIIHNLGWEYFLQQMVISKEPFKYIEKYL